jgi:hypothetical protein
LEFKETKAQQGQLDLARQEQVECRELREVLEPQAQLDREQLEQAESKVRLEVKAQLELLD